MDNNVFRNAMTQFGSGVTVPVTVDDSGRSWGFTASAFCSVALDPPLVLVCPARTAESYPAFVNTERFAIHILGSDQADVATRFAEKRTDKFEDGRWYRAADGLPALNGALARVSCVTHAVHDGGDHAILVGRVVRAEVDEAAGAPLLYFRRRFLDTVAG